MLFGDLVERKGGGGEVGEECRMWDGGCRMGGGENFGLRRWDFGLGKGLGAQMQLGRVGSGEMGWEGGHSGPC